MNHLLRKFEVLYLFKASYTLRKWKNNSLIFFFEKQWKEIFETEKWFLNCQWWQKQNKLIHINQPVLHTREFVLITAASTD